MRRSLAVTRDVAALVVTSSDGEPPRPRGHGVEAARIRVVPLGVDHAPADADAVAAVRRTYGLPERFVLFVGTLEPRKNLRRLGAAMARLADPLPLVVAGPDGWGDGHRRASTPPTCGSSASSPAADLPALYAAATVFAYPSESEGFGLPVAEAMAQGTPVVTSAGTSTEEVAGGAAVLVDPFDVDAIAAGIDEAQRRADELADRRAGAGRGADVGRRRRAHARASTAKRSVVARD